MENKEMLENGVMGEVCLGLSEVCQEMVKIEKQNIKRIATKLELCKKGEIVLWKKTIKKLKDDLRESEKNYDKLKKSFLTKAKLFKDFAKIFKRNQKEVDKEWLKLMKK